MDSKVRWRMSTSDVLEFHQNPVTSTSMTLAVKTVIGEYCLTGEQGHTLLQQYQPFFAAGETIVLDFEGVRIFVSAFFNAAVGPLLKDAPRSEITKRLKVKNLSPLGEKAMVRSLDAAERYYNDATFSKALDAVIASESA